MSARVAAVTRHMAVGVLAALSLRPAAPSIAAPSAGTPPAAQFGNAVVITYRSTVQGRPQLRKAVLKGVVPRLDTWRRNGALAGYQLLFNSFVSPHGWDLMAVLSFKNFDGIEKWRNIERTFPGGLTTHELQLLAPSAEYLMDIAGRSQAAGTESRPGVFLVIPYRFSPTPLDRYLEYAHGYILPETEGWMRHGNISSYDLYVNRFYPDSPVQSLLVIEYKSFDALSHREAVVEQTRKELSADPAWTSWSAAKGQEHIRTEGRAVIAEQLAAR